MKTVQQLIDELNGYNLEHFVYAYEGEFTGLVVVDERGQEVSCIEAKPARSFPGVMWD